MDAEAAHLATHHGVISRSEALELGMSTDQIRHRLRTRRWVRLGPCVFRVASTPNTWRGSVRASALSVDGLASHGTAATVWKIDGWDQTKIEVVVPFKRRPEPRPGLTIHRSKQLHLADPTEIDGVPVTGLARTVLDVAAVASRKRLEWTIDAVLRSGQLDWPALYAVLARHAIQGRDGSGKLRVVLDERYGDNVVPDSKFNRMVGQLLEDAGIAGFFYEYEIYDGDRFLARSDLAFPDHRLAIECDSKRHHLHTDAFENDRQRQNRVTISGWTVLQFTWQTYIKDPVTIVNDVYNALNPRKAKILEG